MKTILRSLWIPVLLLALAACGASPEKRVPATALEISQLALEIRALGENVDPEEAERAARIAYQHTRELALQYQIVDPPLIHNTKVNMGLKPRGLCWHWAEDMEKRLKAENFETLVLYRAIANADNEWRRLFVLGKCPRGYPVRMGATRIGAGREAAPNDRRGSIASHRGPLSVNAPRAAKSFCAFRDL